MFSGRKDQGLHYKQFGQAVLYGSSSCVSEKAGFVGKQRWVEKDGLSDRARNEPRDLYDLWHLLDATDLRIAEMRAELDAKLALRQRVIAGMEQAIAAKEDRLRRLWAARLSHQMSRLPPFDDVFREVLRAVRAADWPKAEV